jgi:DNA-directed RNA polymerase specialized sigma24 family protein
MVRSCKDWQWSSYRATAGLEAAPFFLTTKWILGEFARDPSKACQAYRRFVSAGRGESVWESLKGQICYGSDEFIEQHVPHGTRVSREIPRKQRLVNRPSLEDILGTASEGQAMVSAYRDHGYRLSEIASFLGVHYSTVSRRVKKHEERIS